MSQGENLAELPRGRQTFADVLYHIVDYVTAPIPDCIILGGGRRLPVAIRDLPDRVTGIPVGKRADLLFSLHTAFVSRPIRDDERRRMNDNRRPFTLPTVFHYVLHYADGQTVEIPVVLERDIDHWVQDEPHPLERARLAWVRSLPSLDGKKTVLYSMQVRNPRPDVPIESLDLVADSDRATAAILAVTLGEVLTPDGTPNRQEK